MNAVATLLVGRWKSIPGPGSKILGWSNAYIYSEDNHSDWPVVSGFNPWHGCRFGWSSSCADAYT